MKRRIFRSILFVSVTILILSFVGVFAILYNAFSEEQFTQLEQQASFIADLLEETGESDLDKLNLLESREYRITLINADGTVAYDSLEDASSLSNHLDRKEIQQAEKTGTGQATRYSDTLSEETYNLAKKLPDGSFLRVSVTQTSVFGLFEKALLPVALLMLFALFLSSVLARHLSKSIVAPINNIDLDDPLSSNTYDQLNPLLERIDESNKKIKAQMKELKRKSEEFDAVAQNMDEGLILLSSKNRMIYCNQAARNIFRIQEDWKPSAIPQLEKALQKASLKGRSTFQIRKNSREYIVEVASINTPEKNKGFVILALDTTEKVEAQKRRQEFTANVTHELKTPIQTIMSSAELLQTGLVKAEDQPRFLEYIQKEASHLVELINDIIHLSRLDAGYSEETGPIQLDGILASSLERSRHAAEAKNIDIQVQMEPIDCLGSEKTWKDIFYNLVENAVKYNRENGTVDMSLKQRNQKIVFTISDTGIGIPDKYQDRVFERFFRVDKSHSKTIGGTGLGLAIVQHAIQSLNGTISLRSKEGQGTTITVTVPLRPIEPEPSDVPAGSNNKG